MTANMFAVTGPTESPHRYRVGIDEIASATAGGEGFLYRATDTATGRHVALKQHTSLSATAARTFVRTTTAFVGLQHPNLMQHEMAFLGPSLGAPGAASPDDFDVVYTVSAWVDGIPLTEAIGSVPLVVGLRYLAEVARGLHAMHTFRSAAAPHGFVHRDVKPSNVIIASDGHAVLVDFGDSLPYDPVAAAKPVGTYRWRAPEIVADNAGYTPSTDIWGLGATAHWIITGEPPVLDGASASVERMMNSARMTEVRDAVHIVRHIAPLLETNTRNRPTDIDQWSHQLDDILRRSQHPLLARRMNRALWSATAVGVVAAAIAIKSFGGTELVRHATASNDNPATSSVTSASPPTTALSPTPTSSPATIPEPSPVPSVSSALPIHPPSRYLFESGETAAVSILGNDQVAAGSTLTIQISVQVPLRWVFSGASPDLARSRCLGSSTPQVIDQWNRNNLSTRPATRWHAQLAAMSSSGALTRLPDLVIDEPFTTMFTMNGACATAPLITLAPWPAALAADARIQRSVATRTITVPRATPNGRWVLQLMTDALSPAVVATPVIIDVVR